jgi:alkanesulfonate monooxygenase SsuD/methylene tetrahydromethanopterin reductase-like flavin-dependent oxidoreductase (luciferase family)
VLVCLMIEGQEGVTWDQWKALAAVCEETGIESLFRSDHYLSVVGRRELDSLDAWTQIAALGAVTSKLRLGTLVSPVTFRHPSLLAKVVVTADHVSGGGRVELGLGAGWLEPEHEAYGFPFPPPRERMQMLDEQLQLVRREWEQGAFDFEGEHYAVRNLDALPKPVDRPRLLVGGRGGPRSVELAVRHADEYNTFHKGVDECRELRARLDEACERGGRDPVTLPLSLMAGVSIGRDHPEQDEAWVTGSVEEAAAYLHELEEAGVTRVMLQHLDHEDLDMVELFGHELAPAAA